MYKFICVFLECFCVQLQLNFELLFSKPVEPDRLFDGLPNTMRPSSASPCHDDSSGLRHTAEHQNKCLETVIYHPPTLIPPRILPLLHDLAYQMIQAGHHQQVFNIYRYYYVHVVVVHTLMEQVFPIGNLELASFLASFLIWVQSQSQFDI